MVVDAVEAGGVEETLDAVDRLYTTRVEAEARTFELAAHFADLAAGESLPRSRRVLPGRERAVQVGGSGTPSVAEFAVAELGGRMRMGTWAARNYLADALDVRHRLPLIWARVRSREARVGNARLVAARTRHLTEEAAAYVDRAMADFVDGSLPWGRFEARLTGKVVAADPETAALREEARLKEQFATRTRSAEDGTAGFYVRSTVGVIARLEATVGYVADALKALGDGDDADVRRVKAVVLLCNPAQAVELLAAFAAWRSRSLPTDEDAAPPDEPASGDLVETPPRDQKPAEAHDDALARMDAFARRVRFTPTRLPVWLAPRTTLPERPEFAFDWSKLLPPVTLNLHIATEGTPSPSSSAVPEAVAPDPPDPRGPPDPPDSDRQHRVARWEGVGPVTYHFVREHLQPLHSFVIQPVLDLAHMAPVDAYEIPDRHRRAVLLRTPADCFPFSSALIDPTSQVDVDHSEPHRFAPDGANESAFMSRLENYGPLGRFHHRVKTHSRWVVRQPFPGIYLWRDPHGQVFLVDHCGTHKVTSAGSSAGAAGSYDPDIEVYPADTVIEVDFGGAVTSAVPDPSC